MPNSPECQPIADGIASLTAQEQAARDDLPALTGIDKWKKMQELGTLRQQIAEQQALLDDCEKQHAADLATKVVVIDLPGNSGANRIARTWQLTSDGQAVKQTVTIQDGVANFLGILGGARQSFGITVEETDHPTVNGPDFRSGPLPVALAPNSPEPAARIEIVILDPILITADSISQAAPPLPISFSFPAGPAGTLTFSVTDLRIVVGSGTVSLFASGTASGASFPFPTTSPFTFINTFHIAPAFSMAPSTVLEALTGTVPVLSMPGLVGSIVQNLSPLLSSSLIGRAVQPMMSLLNTRIAKRVATVLGLPALPSGSVLSIRELTASEEGLTITPVLGAFGTVLSDFQPQAPESIVRLAALDVQPASIGTGDPATRVAQGRVNLHAPAPAGGVTIVLSCDRTDVIAIDRPTLFIAEGLQAGTFTITGIGQPLMSLSHVDVTIRASLGTQTLTAPLSIRPENPATVVPPAATPVALPPSPLELSVQPATATFADTPTAYFVVAPRDTPLNLQIFFTCDQFFGFPAPLRAVQIPPGIANYTVPIPLAEMKDSLLKNGFSLPGDLTIIAVADGVSKNAVLRIVAA
jgi:hypothetical protein